MRAVVSQDGTDGPQKATIGAFGHLRSGEPFEFFSLLGKKRVEQASLDAVRKYAIVCILLCKPTCVHLFSFYCVFHDDKLK